MCRSDPQTPGRLHPDDRVGRVDQLGVRALLDCDDAGSLEGDGSHRPAAYRSGAGCTSRSRPVSGSNTKPLMWSCAISSRLERSRHRLWLSVASTSSKAPRRQCGHRAVRRERLRVLVLGRSAQAAAVVHHDHDLLGSEQPLGGAQGAQRVIGHQPPGVADDVGVPALQAEHREQVDPGVHAREHRDPAPGPRAQAGRRELARRGLRPPGSCRRRAACGPDRRTVGSTSGVCHRVQPWSSPGSTWWLREARAASAARSCAGSPRRAPAGWWSPTATSTAPGRSPRRSAGWPSSSTPAARRASRR